MRDHGEFDVFGLLIRLTTIGYHGPISIEWEDARMDGLQGAPEALAYIRSHLFEPPATAFDTPW